MGDVLGQQPVLQVTSRASALRSPSMRRPFPPSFPVADRLGLLLHDLAQELLTYSSAPPGTTLQRFFHIFSGVQARVRGWRWLGPTARGWRVLDRPVGVVVPPGVLSIVAPSWRNT